MLTGPITAMSQPRRKNGHEFHELYENRRAVRAAFESHHAHQRHTPSVIEENSWNS